MSCSRAKPAAAILPSKPREPKPPGMMMPSRSAARMSSLGRLPSRSARVKLPLPLKFGVGVNFVYMERDIEVTDVTVKLGSRPPESISDRANFDVANRTTLSMVRFDAWVLPFLDVYVMAGEARTDTSLVTSFEIAPPMGEPIPVVVEQNSRVDGPVYGGGATLVVGHGAFFAMLDANFARSDLDLFDGTIDALLLSGRAGWFRDTGLGQWRVWTGLMYLDSSRTLTITTEIPVFGPTEVEVEQRPVNPTTLELGGSLSINRRWELLVEVGGVGALLAGAGGQRHRLGLDSGAGLGDLQGAGNGGGSLFGGDVALRRGKHLVSDHVLFYGRAAQQRRVKVRVQVPIGMFRAIGRLLVRMALHSGAAEVREGDYYGTAVNRAARLMSVAHGGQILLSQITRELVEEHLPDSVDTIDLGRHRLRGLVRPETIFPKLHGLQSSAFYNLP
mgnify:CR=1 FL=1